MGSIFGLIKIFKKIKKEETSSDKSLLSQLMKKFRLSLLGTVLLEMSCINTKLGTKVTINKAGYTATPVACGWAGAIFEVTPSFGQEQ